MKSLGTLLPLPALFLATTLAWCSSAALAANTAIEPVAKDPRWTQRHEGFVAEAKKGDIDVLFLGDSITDFWRDRGKEVWDKNFAQLKAANFGISADRTQNVLWRLRNGEGSGFQPKVVVLLIGTNNTGKERGSDKIRNTTAETIEGVTAVVAELRKDFPAAKILFHAIFPREDGGAEQSAQIVEVNKAISKLHDGQHVFFIDINSKFLGADGKIPADIMADKLHPTKKGYDIWAEAIKEPLANLLK